MSVYKPAKSRFYHFDFRYRGDRFCGSTGQESKRAAEEVERRRRRSAALGELDLDDIPTLEQAASLWWREKGEDLATADDCWTRIATLLRLLGKNRRVTDLDDVAINKAMQRRRRETYAKSKAAHAKRYPIQPATVNAEFVTLLRRILKTVARDKRLRAMMPTIEWKDLRLSEPEPYFRIYTAAQRAAWLAECDPTARFALNLLLTYGLRFGELFFPPDRYHPADEDGPPFLLVDKRKRGLMVLPLREDDARLIAARAGRAVAAKKESIWLEQAPGHKLVCVTYDGMHARLSTAAARAGLGAMSSVIHGTRHHAGTMMLQRTQNLRHAQQLLGHASIQSTQRYAHVLHRDLADALEGLSRNSPEPTLEDAEFSPPDQRRRGKP